MWTVVSPFVYLLLLFNCVIMSPSFPACMPDLMIIISSSQINNATARVMTKKKSEAPTLMKSEFIGMSFLFKRPLSPVQILMLPFSAATTLRGIRNALSPTVTNAAALAAAIRGCSTLGGLGTTGLVAGNNVSAAMSQSTNQALLAAATAAYNPSALYLASADPTAALLAQYAAAINAAAAAGTMPMAMQAPSQPATQFLAASFVSQAEFELHSVCVNRSHGSPLHV